MDHVKFLKYKCLTCCNENGCLLFNPPYKNLLLCDCCTYYRSFQCTFYDIPPNSGTYIEKHNGRVDGCWLFYPTGANARNCNACDYHGLLHQPPPSCSHKVTKNLVVSITPSLQGDIMLIDDNNEYLKEPLTKRLKIKWCCIQYNVTPFSFSKVILVDKNSYEITNMNVCDSLDVEMIVISKKL